MPTITLRISDGLLTEVARHSKEMQIPRAEYIRQSLISMNQQMELAMHRKQMLEASRRVRDGSMSVNAEFDAIEYQ